MTLLRTEQAAACLSPLAPVHAPVPELLQQLVLPLVPVPELVPVPVPELERPQALALELLLPLLTRRSTP